MKRTCTFLVAMFLSGCASTITLRGSSNDFLKPAATSVTVNQPASQVMPLLDQLFMERGYVSAGPPQQGDNGSTVAFFKGQRAGTSGTIGVDLGSWFAVRVSSANNVTAVSVLGKPTVSGLELCSDADDLLKDLKYTCTDTRVPEAWAGKSMVSGRDETEVVSWVLTALYERTR